MISTRRFNPWLFVEELPGPSFITVEKTDVLDGVTDWRHVEVDIMFSSVYIIPLLTRTDTSYFETNVFAHHPITRNQTVSDEISYKKVDITISGGLLKQFYI